MATRDQMDRTIVREPCVLVFKEKHGERYFHVPNDETLFAAALQVLKERHADGYWYYKPEPKDKPERAALIAAPDLYRALARVIETIPTCASMYTTVAAALAKARGER